MIGPLYETELTLDTFHARNTPTVRADRSMWTTAPDGLPAGSVRGPTFISLLSSYFSDQRVLFRQSGCCYMDKIKDLSNYCDNLDEL